jgi:dipeptidyl-peptidase 4
VRGGNLFLRRGKDETQISSDGSKEILYGKLDWVYQEEVYGRGNFNAMWWSPDSTMLAFLRVDGSPVGEFTVVDHLPTHLDLEVTNYPKAGDPNPVATLGVYHLESGKTVWMDLTDWTDREPLLVSVGWKPDSSRVVFQVQNRIQNELELRFGDPKSGATEAVIREASPSGWVNLLGEPRWLKDGDFLWWSERSGFKHLYRYSVEGELKNAVTSGEWELIDIVQVDEERQRIWFNARRESAISPHAYRVNFDGDELVHVTPGRGSHRIELNHDASLLIDTVQSLENPGRRVLRDDTGAEIRVLAEAEFRPKARYAAPQTHRIRARDGFMMDATVLLPHDFDAEKSYPVMLLTYSGPAAPSVRDTFARSAWHQFLAQEGVIVLQVNNRSSSLRGQRYTEACYLNFGESELRDLTDAVDWLCAYPWADAKRVGISGWSYGGFMAAQALCRSRHFALGVAGAGAYELGLYDTIYTERYMSTPALNAEGYRQSSPINFAGDLHGHLLMVHGTMDDNVHFQNAVRMSYALQKAGKQFEFMIYPKSRHGVRDPELRKHLRILEWNAIRKHLIDA